MLKTATWILFFMLNGGDGKEPTDRLIPSTWQGNPWGPAATRARQTGELPALPISPSMQKWTKWGQATLREGDIVFRRGDARVLFGLFPFSRFTANVSGSKYSHTGIVAVENGEQVVYDSTKAGVRRQPFCVWVLDNVGSIGVKRLRPDKQSQVPQVIRYCRDVFERQVPFDFDLKIDDSALYCVEMTEKAFRSAGLKLSEPIRLRDVENAAQFPVCMFVFKHISSLDMDQAAFFPGNDRHGIWSSPLLVTVYPPSPAKAVAQPKSAKKPKSTGS